MDETFNLTIKEKYARTWGKDDQTQRKIIRKLLADQNGDEWQKLMQLLEKSIDSDKSNVEICFTFRLHESEKKLDIDNMCKIYIDAIYEDLVQKGKRWPDHLIRRLTAEKFIDNQEDQDIIEITIQLSN